MKLFELAATKPSKEAAKVFESYFGDRINVEVISPRQARMMLSKVQKLVNEHKATPAFHTSEQNPTYLKLMMMERVLATKVKEDGATVPLNQQVGANKNEVASAEKNRVNMPNQAVATQKALAAAKTAEIRDPQDKAAFQKAQTGQTLNPQDQQRLANVAMMSESKQLRRAIYAVLRESEVQQAQVVLASQDMVDEVQKMSEQVSSMQFKDLPALVDQIKNQIGVDQAMQFNTDATAALAGLLQNLQGARQQLDAALGVVTGQAAPQVPGMDDGMAGELGDEELGAEIGADVGAELGDEGPDLSGIDDSEEEPDLGAGLGREKRK